MKFLCYNQNGRHLDTVEELYIYKETLRGSPVNDEHTFIHNKIFDVMLKREEHLTSVFALQNPFHSLRGMTAVICKQTSSNHAWDLLIAREVHKNPFTLYLAVTSVTLRIINGSCLYKCLIVPFLFIIHVCSLRVDKIRFSSL